MDALEDIKKIHVTSGIYYQPTDERIAEIKGQPDYDYNYWSHQPPQTAARGDNDIVNTTNPFVFAATGYSLPNPTGYTYDDLREVADQFMVRTGTAVVGEGQNTSVTGVTEDFWENARSGATCMGAHEVD